jgi:hypothetical protein
VVPGYVTNCPTGKDGGSAVAYICPAPASAKLTFEFRLWPDLSQPGSIDISHKGPCSVYVKRVSDMFKDSAAGPGWFKIYEEGYDSAAGKWCTEKLIANNGLLSVKLPSGLPSGYYLIRPELLGLHQVYENDPQYYVGCAQLFVDSGPAGTLSIPAANSVSIPGHVSAKDPGNTFNIYDPVFPYPIPGPRPYNPTGTPSGTSQKQAVGMVPANCLLKNGNWCGVEVADYSTETGCWAANDNCYKQAGLCYDTSPPTGSFNCETWEAKCKGISDLCDAGKFTGPPSKGAKLASKDPAAPGPLPAAANSGSSGSAASAGSSSSTAGNSNNKPSSAAARSAPQSSSSAGSVAKGNTAGTNKIVTTTTVSKDGTCGSATGQTCRNSGFGDCCSKSGKCGRGKVHCGRGCQPAFGMCRSN